MQMDVLEALTLVTGSYNVVFHRYSICEERAVPFDNVSFDGGLRKWCLPDFDEGVYLFHRFSQLPQKQIIRYIDMFGCRYLMFCYADDGEQQLLIMGPYLSEPNSREFTSAIQKELGWDARMGDSLLEYRSSVPVVLDEQAFVRMVRRIGALLRGQEQALPFGEQIEHPSPGTPVSREEQYEQAMAASMIEQRYQKENEWLDAMLTGNLDKMTAAMRELARFQLPGRFQSLRGAQSIAIILNTLCRKNIERAGVHPAFIDQIARGFTGRIDSCVTEQEVRAIQREIPKEYCLAVNRYAVQGVSPLIRAVISETLLQIDSAISLCELAEKVGVRESYLSARFKEEMGCSFGCWLREKRLERAKQLLERENLSIAQVAEQVGILDVSYFIRIFRKETGVTPGQYRKTKLHLSEKSGEI